MNIFEKMQQDILREHPKMPLWGKFKTAFTPTAEQSVTWTMENGSYTQFFLTRKWRNKEYLVKFGRN